MRKSLQDGAPAFFTVVASLRCRGGQATPEQGEEKDAPKQDMELSVIYSRANSKGFFYFFFFSKSYIINKRVCTFAMIHWRVKRRRYKYRYGCNVKKPPPK